MRDIYNILLEELGGFWCEWGKSTVSPYTPTYYIHTTETRRARHCRSAVGCSTEEIMRLDFWRKSPGPRRSSVDSNMKGVHMTWT